MLIIRPSRMIEECKRGECKRGEGTRGGGRYAEPPSTADPAGTAGTAGGRPAQPGGALTRRNGRCGRVCNGHGGGRRGVPAACICRRKRRERKRVRGRALKTACARSALRGVAATAYRRRYRAFGWEGRAPARPRFCRQADACPSRRQFREYRQCRGSRTRTRTRMRMKSHPPATRSLSTKATKLPTKLATKLASLTHSNCQLLLPTATATAPPGRRRLTTRVPEYKIHRT